MYKLIRLSAIMLICLGTNFKDIETLVEIMGLLLKQKELVMHLFLVLLILLFTFFCLSQRKLTKNPKEKKKVLDKALIVLQFTIRGLEEVAILFWFGNRRSCNLALPNVHLLIMRHGQNPSKGVVMAHSL